ncbi:MAG: hypothetical protein KTR18_09480 [Acidiferrobacterales bacterium]|nr:hypothetical protein [Acidiferrobacterales bacterium]
MRSADLSRIRKTGEIPSDCRPLSRGIRVKALTIALTTGLLVVASGTAFANGTASDQQPLTIDDLGFSGVMDDQLFTTRLKVTNSTTFNAAESLHHSDNSGVELNSMMELESTAFSQQTGGTGLELADSETEEGFRIRRFSTSVENSAGTLTVGNDWSNFQDFLGSRDSVLRGAETVALGSVTASQLQWKNGNGLGVALERGFSSADGEQLQSDEQNPSLVLSWEGASDSGRGQYRMSALGHQLDSDQSVAGEDDNIGWGLNLAGGWRFGDLFAKLSLTLGNSIDSFILGRFSDKGSSQQSKTYELNEAFSISPSINYQLTDKGNIHFSVNRFQSSESNAANGVDTLDTVHLGYTWTPWPSTRFGIEYVGKDVEGGNTEISNSNEVNFAASKDF